MITHQLAHHFGGWKRSPAPPERMPFCAIHRVRGPRPVSVNLRKPAVPVRNQGQEGSCTGFAGRAHLMYETGCSERSPADLYYKERVIEHCVPTDNGASMHDCMDVLTASGVGPEALWPYSDKQPLTAKPPAAEDAAAVLVKLTSSSELHSVDDILDCLADGHTLICGVTCYSSFDTPESARTGLIPMPKRGEANDGGHAQCLDAYHLDFMHTPYFESLKLPAHERHSYWSTVVGSINSWSDAWGAPAGVDQPVGTGPGRGYAWYPAEFLGKPQLASELLTGRA